jgi:hypothetical protein
MSRITKEMWDAYHATVRNKYKIHVLDISSHNLYRDRPSYLKAEQLVKTTGARAVILRANLGIWEDIRVRHYAERLWNETGADIGLYTVPTALAGLKGSYDSFARTYDAVQKWVNGRVWLDIETPGIGPTCDTLLTPEGPYSLDALVGHQVGVYTNPYWLRQYRMGAKLTYNRRPLWLAQYFTYILDHPSFWTPVLWQYTEKLDGKAAGLDSFDLDGNVVYPTSDRYDQLVIRPRTDPAPPPEPPPPPKPGDKLTLTKPLTLAPGQEFEVRDLEVDATGDYKIRARAEFLVSPEDTSLFS